MHPMRMYPTGRRPIVAALPLGAAFLFTLPTLLMSLALVSCDAPTTPTPATPVPTPSDSTRPDTAADAPAPTTSTSDAASAESPAPPATPFAYGTCEPGEGGSGKTYMGREIAEVMGHFGVGWLERPEREREDRTDWLIDALALKPTDACADIGAGSGYFTMRISPLVPEGVVYATDIQQEMLDIVKERALEEGALNVMPVMGRIDHCGLEPSSVDIVLFVDAYHEFSHPREMMESIVTALKPGGRVYLVEYRLEDPFVLIKERHKMSEKQARLEMEAVGLAFVENIGVLPQQHILVFRRD
jgi:precorrin-6B methylase 2